MKAFDSYWNRISQFADDHYIDRPTLLNQFLGGLLTDIKTKVFAFNPKTLTVAHQKALFAEQATKFVAETTAAINTQDTPSSTASDTTDSSRQTTAPDSSSNTYDQTIGYDPGPPPENTNFKCQTCHIYGHTTRQCKYSVDINKRKGTFENSRGGLKSRNGKDPKSMTFVNSKFTDGLQYNPEIKANEYNGYNSPDVKLNQFKGYSNPEVKTKEYNGYNSPDVKISQYNGYSNPEVKTKEYNGYNSPDVKISQYNGYSNPEVKTKEYNGYNSPDVNLNQFKRYSNPEGEI